MATEFVVIEHKDGRQYAVRPKDFHAGADDAYKGFRIVGYEDGTPFEEPKAPAKQAGS